MIDGVVIKKLKVFQDIPDRPEDEKNERGFLIEVLRSDQEFFKKFGQSTFTVAHEGTVKAFHWHKKQDDLWFAATGKAVVVLYDQRKDSKTYKQTQVIEAGKDDYKLIVIPVGVVHGYKVVSKEPVLMFYHTTEPYNPKSPDEERLAWNDAEIGFDWSKY
ncbi:MAG: spore coat protein [Candidatus Doudnabacteria bacterium CG10_big_fil_rev_8_21_14_0_10_41_10]|uniref:Spore coat protein n=1 Tax=Candidatus Doudnabacteria bacterium CG10_big_fil_rev_8_21_14_0_10_41_10 TaxID=1974551 RepID=A0A2H0VDB5_9BACT|nr:MAG: spore coat protein [Candidatus Doudnabacteria bacterium CG10_big_fil_rev_8_21_14_0_10_41_10]